MYGDCYCLKNEYDEIDFSNAAIRPYFPMSVSYMQQIFFLFFFFSNDVSLVVFIYSNNQRDIEIDLVEGLTIVLCEILAVRKQCLGKFKAGTSAQTHTYKHFTYTFIYRRGD